MLRVPRAKVYDLSWLNVENMTTTIQGKIETNTQHVHKWLALRLTF